MIAISNDFKTAMKQPIKELDAYIELDEDTKITSADDLISFKLSCDTSMCKTAMRKLEGKYLGEHNLLGQWVHVGFGVKLPNGTFEYLDYGSFLVTEITTVKDTGVTTVVGYDKMINSMTQYSKLDVEYPISLYEYTDLLCNKCGLILGNETFTHANWLIKQELWENINGITYRDILVQIAQVTASTCIISNDDKVYFKPIYNTKETLTYDNMKKLKLEPMYGEINSVVLSRTPQEDNIYMRDDESIQINGLTEYKIENNEIIDKDRDNAMIPIYNALHGISYYPFETTTEGLGWYEIADSFDIVNDIGEVVNTSLFNFSITIDGGIKEILKTVADTKTQTQYQYATTIGKRVKNTELIVDKQQQSISALVSTTEEHSEQISQNTIDINGIKQTVSGTYDFTREGLGYSKLTIEKAQAGNLLGLSITGEMELLIHNYDLVPSDDLISLDSYLVVENSSGNKSKVRLPIGWLHEVVSQYEIQDADGNIIQKKEITSDEFVLERIYNEDTKKYESRCKIIRRVAVDENGNKSVAVTRTEEDLGTLDIPLFKGTNKIYLESFQNMKYTAKYVIINEVTESNEENFALKTELNSAIEQTEKSIDLSVSKKLEDYSTTEETEARIKLLSDNITLGVANGETSARIVLTINGEQKQATIQLTGVVTFNNLKNEGTTVINGSNITTGTINCDLLNGGTINGQKVQGGEISGTKITGGEVYGTKIGGATGEIGGWNLSNDGLYNGNNFIHNNGYSNLFTYADIVVIRNYLLGKISFNEGDINRYDLNNDGKVDSADLLLMRQKILNIS